MILSHGYLCRAQIATDAYLRICLSHKVLGMEISMKIIAATGNKGKLEEIARILDPAEFELISMKETGFDREVKENGTSYEENALIKVKAVREYLDDIGYPGEYLVIADDSGLEVDYLNGCPGIFSARYMGEDTPYTVKNRAIVDALKNVPDEKRSARFICAIAVMYPDRSTQTVRGVYEGLVSREIKGTYGFGYDPMFFVPKFGVTDAELPPEVKNRVSHRAQALRLAEKNIKLWLTKHDV